MLCVLLKLVNFTVKTRLYNYIEQQNLFPSYSFGFKKKTSTINCVNTLTTHIQDAKRNSQVIVGTYLDCTKAFDNVNVQKLLDILQDLNVPHNLINWIYRYLKKRKIIIRGTSPFTGRLLIPATQEFRSLSVVNFFQRSSTKV